MKVIRDYEKLRLDTSSDQIIKEFATYIDIPSIQAAIYRLTNLQISFQFAYMKELLRIIREKLEAIVVYVEEELGYEIDEQMKSLLKTAENLEEAVEALEDYDPSDDNSTREMPEDKDVQDRTTEIKTTVDLILPPEIIVAIADAGKRGAEEVAKESGKAAVTTATVVNEAPKETTKDAVQEQAKTAAEEVVSHVGSGAAIDAIIDAIRDGATSIDVAGTATAITAAVGTAAVVATTTGTAVAGGFLGAGVMINGIASGVAGAVLEAGGSVGTAAAVGSGIAAGTAVAGSTLVATGAVGIPLAIGAIAVDAAGRVLEEQERTHLADAIEHAKEAVEDAIANGKSTTEAQWAGIEALGPSSPGAPNTTGYTAETLGINMEDLYGLLGDYANEQAEGNNPTNGDSTNGSNTDGYGTNDNSNDLTQDAQNDCSEGDCSEGDCSEGDCGDGDCDEGNEGCAGASDIW